MNESYVQKGVLKPYNREQSSMLLQEKVLKAYNINQLYNILGHKHGAVVSFFTAFHKLNIYIYIQSTLKVERYTKESHKVTTYQKIILCKIVYNFTPECRIFVHSGPIKMAKEDFLLIFIKRA